jgi:pimeloyl-ACP methyl ester carboxylesterase
VWLIFFCFLLSGCGYMKMAGSKLRAVVSPTPANVKKGTPENCVLVSGRVSGQTDPELPLMVAAVADDPSKSQVIDHTMVSGQGNYFLYLPKGRYKLMVFGDLDHNHSFEASELVGSYGAEAVEVDRQKACKGIINGLDITITPDKPDTYPQAFKQKISPHEKLKTSSRLPAEITDLNDKHFLLQNGALGLYQPAAFFEQGCGFFYLLEEDDPAKIPIIFIHGAGGTPLSWQFMVAELDRSRFQPWFFYYPSGLSLETNAEVFLDTVLTNASARSTPVVIAAHSMGGLIARAAINRAVERGNQVRPGLFISFCTPYGGVYSAAKIASHSPVVLPSWKDIAKQSPFISGLFQQPLPPVLDFYLFFAYKNDHLLNFGPKNDGSISLESQLAVPAQEEAVRLFGFDETHDSILTSAAAREAFFKLLNAKLGN